ncbi:hypothetical protein BHX98_19580 [Acinetobacter baumannii]|nr:hypothetical protein BHX98_19580 [Acinetobacter baumannii]
MGDMRMIPTEAQALIEDFQEDAKDGITPITAIGLAVDIEQQHIGLGSDGTLDVGSEHRIGNFALEEIDGLARFAVLADLLVLQQIRENFQKVRFTRPEETGDPHPHSP